MVLPFLLTQTFWVIMDPLFIALPLPSSIREALKRICCGIPHAAWVDEENFHLTLRYLGKIDESLFLDLKEALLEIQAHPFTLRLQGAGLFPMKKLSSNAILWVGVEKSEPLLRLKRKIEYILAKFKVAPEERSFQPHVTVAKIDNSNSSKLFDYLASHYFFQTEPFKVSHFSLLSSHITPKRTLYPIEAEYDLL